MTDVDFDIALVGGGPVGLTLALALTRSLPGVRLALLDRRAVAVPPDQRASAIAAGVRCIFEALEVWPDMVPHAEPIRQMRLTDSGTGDISRPLFLSFEGPAAPAAELAHMVPNRVLSEVLLARLGGQMDVLAPVEITGFSGDGPLARIALKDGRVVRAPLVVAADGALSAMRAMAGIGVITHDYRQFGIVTTIAHDVAHAGVAYEHFRPAGPFASLPLSGNRSSLVWTETPVAAARYGEMGLPAVAEIIEAVMGSTLGRVTVEEKLQMFPLSLRLARSFVGPRLALIGDAAHVVHPVAGQGLNLGLKDVAALTEVVVEAMRLGLDHGAGDVLERYQRWRRFDTALMAMVTDAMNRLFSNDVPPVRALRDLGLGVVDRLPGLKAFMIDHAAGVRHDGPRLMRGLLV